VADAADLDTEVNVILLKTRGGEKKEVPQFGLRPIKASLKVKFSGTRSALYLGIGVQLKHKLNPDEL